MVPKLGVHFINRSPRVGLNRVEADFILTRPAASITCQLKPGRRANTVRDCELIIMLIKCVINPECGTAATTSCFSSQVHLAMFYTLTFTLVSTPSV